MGLPWVINSHIRHGSEWSLGFERLCWRQKFALGIMLAHMYTIVDILKVLKGGSLGLDNNIVHADKLLGIWQTL